MRQAQVNVSWRDVVLLDMVTLTVEQDGQSFLRCKAPMPVGTELVLRPVDSAEPAVAVRVGQVVELVRPGSEERTGMGLELPDGLEALDPFLVERGGSTPAETASDDEESLVEEAAPPDDVAQQAEAAPDDGAAQAEATPDEEVIRLAEQSGEAPAPEEGAIQLQDTAAQELSIEAEPGDGQQMPAAALSGDPVTDSASQSAASGEIELSSSSSAAAAGGADAGKVIVEGEESGGEPTEKKPGKKRRGRRRKKKR